MDGPLSAHIRPYRPSDLDALYEICVRTGASGQDASDLVADRRLFGEIYAAPYGHLEPELAFVLDGGNGTAVGYALGALDTRSFEARCEASWWPSLRERHPPGSGGAPLDELLVAMLHEPHLASDALLADHPSHLHIDLLPSAQGSGWGRRLMEQEQAALRAVGSPGLHVGVSAANERALGFYAHLGYVELSSSPMVHTFGLRL